MSAKSDSHREQDARLPEAALQGSLRDYRVLPGTDLIARVEPFYDWQDLRRHYGLWPYAKSTSTAPKTFCTAMSDSGAAVSGVNFASQDYLSLASHPGVKQAAVRAIEEYGVHSAGSAALLGNTKHSLQLERVISRVLLDRQIVRAIDEQRRLVFVAQRAQRPDVGRV